MIHHAPAASQASLALDWENVRTPPSQYRPTPLWSWNETLPLDEVRRQVREMARAGLGGAFMHARIGLTTPYLGEEYLAAVKAAVEEADRLGLHMYLYDEDRWPSGWGGGRVPLRDERFRVKWLHRTAPDEPPPHGEHVTLLHRDRDGAQFYRVISPLGHPNFSGTSYADLMDREAVQAFLDVAYEPFARAVGGYFGTVIPAMFTDEPAVTYLTDLPGLPRPALPWTDALPEQFARDHGYELLSRVGELFEDVGDYAATRTDYYRTCAGLFERNYTGQLAQWCRAHGLAFTGHFMGEHALSFALAWDVSILPHYRLLDWPGVDHLGLQVQEAITPIGCRSVVNQCAKPRMTSELYGTSGQHLTFADRKWIAEQQIVLGANFLVPHLMLFTMTGERKRDYPPNLSYQQPWWPYNRALDDYLSRLCALMSQGRMVPEFLVLHPQESLYPLRRPPGADSGQWAFSDARDRTRLDAIDRGFQALTRTLLDGQRSFDFGDEAILAEVGTVATAGSHALLRVGAMEYPLVLLPPLTSLRTTTLDLLDAFAAAGGPILATGSMPALLDGRPDESGRLQRLWETAVEFVSADRLLQRLAHLTPPQVRVGAGEQTPWLWQQTRQVGDRWVIMLVNLSRHEPVHGTLHLGVSGPLARLDLAAQNQTIIARDAAPVPPFEVRLAPGESAIFVAGEPPDIAVFPAASAPRLHAERLEISNWQIERLDENALILDSAAYRCAEESFGAPVPVTAIQHLLTRQGYNGPLALRYTFDNTVAEGAARPLTLVVEHPERCTITVNGTTVTSNGDYWRDIRWSCLVIAPYVHAGENTIVLTYDAFRPGDMASYDESAARYGTEIEPIYLIGDFAVASYSRGIGTGVLPLVPALPWRLHVLDPRMSIEPSRQLAAGDLVPQGLPFYAGRVAYRASFVLDDTPDEATLTVARLDAPVAEVRVNGQPMGALAWEPYRLDITAGVHRGTNTVEIVLAHSLRNLLGPHHNAAGETSWMEPEVLFVGPQSFHPEAPGWATELARGAAVDGWDPAYRVTPFGLSTPAVIEWTRRDT